MWVRGSTKRLIPLFTDKKELDKWEGSSHGRKPRGYREAIEEGGGGAGLKLNVRELGSLGSRTSESTVPLRILD